jgi:hypothetical protein
LKNKNEYGPETVEGVKGEKAEKTITTDLVNKTAYTFTIKAFDKEGNPSVGENSVPITPYGPSGGGLSVNFEPPPIEVEIKGVEEGTTLSWNKNTKLTASVEEKFGSYEWVLDDDTLTGETRSSVTLYGGKLSFGDHNLTVVVTVGGVRHTDTVTFKVTMNGEK